MACATCNLIRGILLAQGYTASTVDAVVGLVEPVEALVVKKAKKVLSPYQKRYKRAFSQLKSKYQTKAGKWKANGFRKAVKAAHKEASE